MVLKAKPMKCSRCGEKPDAGKIASGAYYIGCSPGCQMVIGHSEKAAVIEWNNKQRIIGCRDYLINLKNDKGDVTSSGVSVTMQGDGIETLAVSTSLAEQLLNIVACPKCKTIQRFDSNGITCAKWGLDFSDERYSRYRRVLKALNLPHICDPATKFFSGNEINCPFCNSPGVIGAMKTNGGDGALYWYECTKCGGRTPRKATPGEAREKAEHIALAIVSLEWE